jgi:uncharacterized protein
MKNLNPFITGRYEDPAYFCDRESETNRLQDAFNNQRNITLISPRRLGKTGLILHFFNQIKKQKGITPFYIDLMHTTNLEQFITTFAKTIIGKFDNKTAKLLASFSNIVKSLRPTITIDPMTGQPAVDINLSPGMAKESSIEEIFKYLAKQEARIIIAFDEFQQVGSYPEKGTEALLRSHIQFSGNASFIFSGSHKHILMNMFGDHSRPFYQSTEILNLGKIDRASYRDFIIEKFRDGQRNIDHVAADFILDLTDNYTWYVQFLCNKLYGLNTRKIDNELIVTTLLNVLKEQEVIYYNYRNLLTRPQFDLLRAIAHEGRVTMPTARDFLHKHGLSAASSVRTSLDALIGKEMILADETGYSVYDVFFAQWLKRF